MQARSDKKRWVKKFSIMRLLLQNTLKIRCKHKFEIVIIKNEETAFNNLVCLYIIAGCFFRIKFLIFESMDRYVDDCSADRKLKQMRT